MAFLFSIFSLVGCQMGETDEPGVETTEQAGLSCAGKCVALFRICIREGEPPENCAGERDAGIASCDTCGNMHCQ
jgi:hypothetical protein